jgi:hypothetical protein
MFVDRVGSGVGLGAQMQPEGNLENSWIMFNHVHQVANWTMMTYHVYDPRYCKVITIPICDM